MVKRSSFDGLQLAASCDQRHHNTEAGALGHISGPLNLKPEPQATLGHSLAQARPGLARPARAGFQPISWGWEIANQMDIEPKTDETKVSSCTNLLPLIVKPRHPTWLCGIKVELKDRGGLCMIVPQGT